MSDSLTKTGPVPLAEQPMTDPGDAAGTLPSPRPGVVTVVEQVYHQAPGAKTADNFSHGYDHAVQSDLDPYSRPRERAGAEWTPVSLGWVERASLVRIQHVEGGVIEVGVAGPMGSDPEAPRRPRTHWEAPRPTGVVVVPLCELHPRRSLRLPNPTNVLFVRCKAGEARYALVILPQ